MRGLARRHFVVAGTVITNRTSVKSRDERLFVHCNGGSVPIEEGSALNAELYDSSDRWRSLFERSTLGVALTDSAFRFIIANPVFLTMLGYSSEELQQLSFLDICVDEVRDETEVLLHELREGVRLQNGVEAPYRRKDGTFLPVNTSFLAINGRAPNHQIFLTVTVEITARQKPEGVLRADHELGGLHKEPRWARWQRQWLTNSISL